jgi:site-specific DNA recombinase
VRCADGCNGEADELRFLRQVLQSVAELQKRQLVARLAAGRRLKAVRGGYAGGRPPFGYRARGGALVPDEEQAQVVRWVFERVADGWSTRRITAALDAKRTLGRGWTVTTISRMLNRRAYKLGPPGARIVDPRVWNRASAVLTAHRPMMF